MYQLSEVPNPTKIRILDNTWLRSGTRTCWELLCKYKTKMRLIKTEKYMKLDSEGLVKALSKCIRKINEVEVKLYWSNIINISLDWLKFVNN